MVRHAPGSHTAKLLAKTATDILGEFGVKLDKLVHFVTDIAAPVKLAMTKLMDNVVWRLCFARTMQLVVNGVLAGKKVSDLSKILAKARSIVGHFRRSLSATTAGK